LTAQSRPPSCQGFPLLWAGGTSKKSWRLSRFPIAPYWRWTKANVLYSTLCNLRRRQMTDRWALYWAASLLRAVALCLQSGYHGVARWCLRSWLIGSLRRVVRARLARWGKSLLCLP
jgi:hypothetical protein